ncbi:MAG TPA: helix-turn-helix transcriptional regulator [Candidatus Angelobacter sp.]
MAKKIRELRKTMSPAAREKARLLAEKYSRAMPLDELRAARRMTQEHLARLLGTKQAAISKLERRTDMYLSTLQSIVKAMGGQLRIEALFPEGAVEIDPSHRVKRSNVRAKPELPRRTRKHRRAS